MSSIGSSKSNDNVQQQQQQQQSKPKRRSYDEVCMKAAISLSQVAVDKGCMPFGAVLADSNGNIIVEAHNCSKAAKKRGGTGDVTRHAEMELVRSLTQTIPEGQRKSCTIYTSTEPCVMCGGAIYWSGINRVVYGCSAAQLETLSGPGGFDIPIEQLYSLGRDGTRKIDVFGPLLAEEAMQVHKDSGIWSHNSNPSSGDNNNTNNASSRRNDSATPVVNIGANEKDIETERSLFRSGLGSAPAENTNNDKSGDGDADLQVPIISMDQSKYTEEEIAQKLWDAANTVGFFTVIDHGISTDLIQRAFDVSSQFFNQDQIDKETQSPFAKHLNAGYEYYSQIRPSTGTPDQKESLQITARESVMDGRWPTTPQNFKHVATDLLKEAHKLSGRILDLLEPKACPQNPKGTISRSHTLWADDGQCTLRMLHYPPIDYEQAKILTTRDPETGRIHFRAGPHTDWANVTLLFQQLNQPGLECCSNPNDISKATKHGGLRWTPVDPVPGGGITVNIGDMLSRWSDQRLYSNLHRVRMPRTAEECTASRYSIAFFAQSDKSTMIHSHDSPPISAGEYILSRVRSNFEK